MEETKSYIQINPTWHSEDSPWKAKQILRMINKNNLHPKSIIEIGCGVGEILNQLHEKMEDKNIQFSGYEIAREAFERARQNNKPRLQYFNINPFNESEKFDLLLMIDVFEHVEDPFKFLRMAAAKSKFKIYHIPLDITIYNILINNFKYMRYPGGHINYYTKFIALETLKETGHEIVDFFYTPGYLELNQKDITLVGKVLNWSRKILYKISPDFTAKFLGGYSLMVLAK